MRKSQVWGVGLQRATRSLALTLRAMHITIVDDVIHIHTDLIVTITSFRS